MIDWQANLTKSLQKENPNGNVTTTNTTAAPHNNGMNEMDRTPQQEPSFSLIQTKSQ